MRKKDKDIKKYISTNRPTINSSLQDQDFLQLDSRPISEDIREQLRACLE